jgi:hypothetical protein
VSGKKRSLKKQQKRQETALTRLEELYRRGVDDEILVHAAEQVADLAGSPFAAKWTEVADRAVRQSLAGGDLGRLERLLRSLRRSGPLRPLAILGEGVLEVAAGRLDAARSRLALVSTAEGGAGALPPRLLAEIQSLARDAPDLSQDDDPYLRAVADLFAALQGLETGGFAPAMADREALARGLQTLRSLASAEDSQLRLLLAAGDRCLSLLAVLEGFEAWLAEPPKGDEARGSQAVILWLRELGPLAPALGACEHPLLAPLHQTVRMRWRSVLKGVAAQEGSPGLAALYAADPRLLAQDVDLAGGGLADLRQRAQAQQLLASGRYEELIHLLRSRSRTAVSSGDLAALWSLELWAGRRSSRGEEDEDDENLAPDLTEFSDHDILVRLGEMGVEVGRRFPPEQRAEVARVLRDELFELCEVAGFCDHTAEAALSLLEHQPGDSGLVIAGVAGAIAGDTPRLLRALEPQLGGVGRANAGPVEQRLMEQVAQEGPRHLPRILDKLKPLFSAVAWAQVAELVGREVGDILVEVLCVSAFEATVDPESASGTRTGARVSLELLRPVLAGTLGFAAIELALDCWRPDRLAVEKRLARFLDGSPGYEGVLAALHVLEKCLVPWAPQGVEVAFRGLAQAAVDRLDDRWQLWGHAMPMLAVAVDDGALQRLKKKLQQLLASPGIQEEGRRVLEESLEAIDQVESMRRERDHPRRRPRPKKKSRRRGGGVPQLGLDFP